jgi:hypothetical protein
MKNEELGSPSSRHSDRSGGICTSLKPWYQTDVSTSLDMTTSPAYYELRLFNDDTSGSYDALFVATSDYASNDQYVIGRDVIKMGINSQAAQIWCFDYDVALCAYEARSENGAATIPLFIHTPVAGKKYHLQLQNKVKESEQLWLCHSGKPIHNLTEIPEFTIEGTGGTTDEYSLRTFSDATSNNPVETGDIHVYSQNNTIIITGLQVNDNYLIYDLSGRLFANGKATGSPTKVTAVKGAYVVYINGNSYKVIVY